MYIPKHNQLQDFDAIVAFIQRFNFATLVSNHNSKIVATHLPFVVHTKENKIILTTHFAKANPHWQQIEEQDVLIIFQEPHAYISPSLYTSPDVPTWNYIAVHLYGNSKIVNNPIEVDTILYDIMCQSDPHYLEHYNKLTDEYKEQLKKGIVAIEIEIKEIEGKHKLSQNKSQIEKENIIQNLSMTSDGAAQLVGEYMQKIKKD